MNLTLKKIQWTYLDTHLVCTHYPLKQSQGPRSQGSKLNEVILLLVTN